MAFAHRHWQRLVGLIAGLALAAVGGAVAGGFVLLSGAYNTAATKQHFAPTHWLLEQGLKFSVANAARELESPTPGTGQLRVGAACFEAYCAQCHGAPGVAPQPWALGMLPVPTNLAQAGRDWSPAELFWLVSKGVRMTGMPAWEYRISIESRWATVAYLRELPLLTRARYEALAAEARTVRCAPALGLGDVAHEEDADRDPRRTVIYQYACHACHRIQGVVGPAVDVGPPLEGWPARKYVAGVLPNTHANLVRWITAPQEISPGTLMPDLGVTEAHARVIADFLFDQASP
jgi:mono/diheme cytochrome c family protein